MVLSSNSSRVEEPSEVTIISPPNVLSDDNESIISHRLVPMTEFTDDAGIYTLYIYTVL